MFLSAEDLVIKLEGNARQGVVNRQELLREITQIDENWRHRQITAYAAKVISRAVEEAGIKESVRMRRVGSYELQSLLDESDTYQDWLALHPDLGCSARFAFI